MKYYYYSLITTKLEAITKKEWELITGNIKLLDLIKFLKNYCKYIRKIIMEKSQLSKPQFINTDIRIRMG